MKKDMTVASDRLGNEKEGKILAALALPLMISMLIQALYNIVDSMFVAQLSEDALTAVSISFPIQNLMIAVGTGIGVGTNAQISKFLGRKDNKSVEKVVIHGLILVFISFLLFVLIGLFGIGAFLKFQNLNDSINTQATSYLRIVSIMSFGLFGQLIFERLLQSTGKTILSMISQGAGAILNVILDPILIFGLFGLPKMGVAGAAYATIIGQFVAFIIGLQLHRRYNTEIPIKFRGFKFDMGIIKRILSIGIPSIIMVSISSFLNFGINKILTGLTTTATAVFGAYFKLQSFVFMPVFGLNSALIPLISYNIGARNKTRVKNFIKLGLISASIIMLLGLGFMQFFPDTLLRMFNASNEMMIIGVPALKIISLSFVMAGASIIIGAVLQVTGRGFVSASITAFRQLIILLPLAYIFSLTGRVELIWWAFPISEAIAIIFSFALLKSTIKTRLRF